MQIRTWSVKISFDFIPVWEPDYTSHLFLWYRSERISNTHNWK